MVLSLERKLAPAGLVGSTVLMTCLTLFSAATLACTAGLFFASVSVPLRAWSTTGLEP
jgi:hypothetical protein